MNDLEEYIETRKKKDSKLIPVTVIQLWDGRDSDGNIVPVGSYKYKIQGVLVRITLKGKTRSLPKALKKATKSSK